MSRLLVVDDDPSIIQLLELLLMLEGFEVATAADPVEALALAERHEPDLVLVDMMMPGMDGTQLTRELRAIPGNASLPVIAVTAKSSPQDTWLGWQAGVDSYVPKPFEPEELLAEIRRVLEWHGLAVPA